MGRLHNFCGICGFILSLAGKMERNRVHTIRNILHKYTRLRKKTDTPRPRAGDRGIRFQNIYCFPKNRLQNVSEYGKVEDRQEGLAARGHSPQNTPRKRGKSEVMDGADYVHLSHRGPVYGHDYGETAQPPLRQVTVALLRLRPC